MRIASCIEDGVADAIAFCRGKEEVDGEVADAMRDAVERVRRYRAEHPSENSSWVWEYLPKVLPRGWRVFADGGDGRWWEKSLPELRVCLSGSTEEDGRRWLHLSVSHRQRIPTWDELVECKELFLGVEAGAVQVIPPRSQHVNLCDRVLHLWRCVDGEVLPDFTRGTGSI